MNKLWDFFDDYQAIIIIVVSAIYLIITIVFYIIPLYMRHKKSYKLLDLLLNNGDIENTDEIIRLLNNSFYFKKNVSTEEVASILKSYLIFLERKFRKESRKTVVDCRVCKLNFLKHKIPKESDNAEIKRKICKVLEIIKRIEMDLTVGFTNYEKDVLEKIIPLVDKELVSQLIVIMNNKNIQISNHENRSKIIAIITIITTTFGLLSFIFNVLG